MENLIISKFMDKHEVAQILYEVSQIFEIQGENPFRVRAYQNAARIIEGLSDDLELLVKSEGLIKLRGIGPNLAAHIKELVLTGRLKEYEQMLRGIPEGLFDMLKIHGLGPKKVGALWRELSIASIGELEYACKENRLIELPGFGEKTQTKILRGLEFLKRFEGRYLYSEAKIMADELLQAMQRHKDVIKAEIAGSIRRCKETVKDIDLLIATKKPKVVSKKFISLPHVDSVTAEGETKTSVILYNGLAVDLRVVSEKEFPYALHHFTGSKEHNVAMRSLAKKQGVKMNEYGLFKGTELLKCKDEVEIYKRLGLAFIPPELREDQGEIEAARKDELPDLITENDIKGIFHVHSTWSDGRDSIEAMASAAKNLGYKYIGISDQSQSAQNAGGLQIEKIKKQHKEIDKINKRNKGLKILKGVESDILPDGSLDYPDSVLELFDFVIISVHSQFNMSEDRMTERIIKAMQNPYTSILGHPTGRLLLARDAYAVNMHKVIDAASDYGVAIEINSHPQRLDLDWRHGKYAKSKGIKVTINPDAHSVEGLTDVKYGVGIARKGWFEKKDVLNCLNVSEVEEYFKKRR